MSNIDEERVLILGAGPVGLAAALELSRFGVRSLVLEKHPGISWHPKTRNFNTRTMEIARAWGLDVYGRLRNIDTPPGWKSPIRFLESAVGEEYASIDSKGFSGPGPSGSPAEPVMSSQELIEEIMLDAALGSGLVEVQFEAEAVRLVKGGEPDATEAVLEVKDLKSGKTLTLTGVALVAADGASSLIREELGLVMEGAKDLSHLVNCFFRADIEPQIGDRKGVLLFVNNPNAQGVLQPLDAKGRWLSQIYVSEEDWSEDVFTKDRARDWVRAAAGVNDLDVDILSVGFWKLNATVADRLVNGRVLMCGDSAHQFPPTGGLGVNTGLQGLHNVMWKLAYCVQGKAGWNLLKTYQDERRIVAKTITEQSLQNSINVQLIFEAARSGAESGMSADQVAAESRRYGNHLGVEFGALYSSSAVIPDGSTVPEVKDSYSDYVQSATPGARLPHFWLGPNEGVLSTLDLIGPNLTLVAGPNAKGWVEQAKTAAKQLSVPVDVREIGTAGLSDAGQFEREFCVQSDGALLVRPDCHIAWKATSAPAGEDELEWVITNILSR
jgi:putative polyketide hydroxylase